jgi:hypothetical protein
LFISWNFIAQHDRMLTVNTWGSVFYFWKMIETWSVIEQMSMQKLNQRTKFTLLLQTKMHWQVVSINLNFVSFCGIWLVTFLVMQGVCYSYSRYWLKVLRLWPCAMWCCVMYRAVQHHMQEHLSLNVHQNENFASHVEISVWKTGVVVVSSCLTL